jgi:quinol monooxygenase YgiN
VKLVSRTLRCLLQLPLYAICALISFSARAAHVIALQRTYKVIERGLMLAQVVRLTVNMTVNEGQLDAFKAIAATMTEGSKTEPGTLGYEWFAHPDDKRFCLLETYSNAAAVEAHFTGPVVQQWVPKLAAVCTVDGFEFCGDPGPRVREMAAAFGAVFFPYWLGIDR